MYKYIHTFKHKNLEIQVNVKIQDLILVTFEQMYNIILRYLRSAPSCSKMSLQSFNLSARFVFNRRCFGKRALHLVFCRAVIVQMLQEKQGKPSVSRATSAGPRDCDCSRSVGEILVGDRTRLPCVFAILLFLFLFLYLSLF